MNHSKTKTSFYRRMYVAWLIEQGINTVPKLMEETGMPRRTAQDTIAALHELDVQCEFRGATKDGVYRIEHWGAINSMWIQQNLTTIKEVLGY